jgi:Fe-S-cluster-containing hydrogenase component 2
VTVRAASTSVNSQQHGDVLPHFREQRCLGFGMKLCLTACPVQAFKLVEQDSTFHLIDFAGQREGIWFGTEHPVTVRAQQEVLAACFAGWT